MHIRDYQRWLEDWDKARSWDQVLVSHTLLHAQEELGEISKLVQMVEGYRAPKPADLGQVRELLALELSDMQVMLFKIAYLCGIDMEHAMQSGMAKADARFPDPAAGITDRQEYWLRFRAYLDRMQLSEHLPDADSRTIDPAPNPPA